MIVLRAADAPVPKPSVASAGETERPAIMRARMGLGIEHGAHASGQRIVNQRLLDDVDVRRCRAFYHARRRMARNKDRRRCDTESTQTGYGVQPRKSWQAFVNDETGARRDGRRRQQVFSARVGPNVISISLKRELEGMQNGWIVIDKNEVARRRHASLCTVRRTVALIRLNLQR